MRPSHLPLRLSTGAFILNSGLAKRDLPPEAAAGIQGMAAPAVPPVANLAPATFGKALSTGEIALGAALLTPFVSPVVAGAALTAFSGTLLRVWWLTPGMHEEGSIKPTEDGTPIAKDVFMLGAGLALLTDGLLDGARRTAKATKKSARKTAASTKKNARKKAKAARKALPVG